MQKTLLTIGLFQFFQYFQNFLTESHVQWNYRHLRNNNLLFNKQFGFQLNNPTEHAILQLFNDISSSFERGEYTIGICIDLSKPFDTVDHEILISKLEYYGIKGKTLK